MIGQYLSHTNERDTVAILQKIWEVNKAISKHFAFYGHLNTPPNVSQVHSNVRIPKNLLAYL